MVEIKIREGKGIKLDVEVKGSLLEMFSIMCQLETAVHDVLEGMEKTVDCPGMHEVFIGNLESTFVE